MRADLSGTRCIHIGFSLFFSLALFIAHARGPCLAADETATWDGSTGNWTDPDKWDTDGDGLDDGTELSMGIDPLDADTDDDGASDNWEVLRGTDPNDPDDTPPLSLPALGPWGQAVLLLVLAGSAASRLRLRRRQG